MTKFSFATHPNLLGFEEIDRLVDRAIKTGNDSYPPYNIEQSNQNVYNISIAVAGFKLQDLSVAVEESTLVIRGDAQETSVNKVYIHRGIARRQFKKTFVMAEGVEVECAELANGLLNISLIRKRLKPIVRIIDIKSTQAKYL